MKPEQQVFFFTPSGDDDGDDDGDNDDGDDSDGGDDDGDDDGDNDGCKYLKSDLFSQFPGWHHDQNLKNTNHNEIPFRKCCIIDHHVLLPQQFTYNRSSASLVGNFLLLQKFHYRQSKRKLKQDNCNILLKLRQNIFKHMRAQTHSTNAQYILKCLSLLLHKKIYTHCFSCSSS